MTKVEEKSSFQRKAVILNENSQGCCHNFNIYFEENFCYSYESFHVLEASQPGSSF